MGKDGGGGLGADDCCGSKVRTKPGPLEKVITEAMSKLGIEDANGEVQLWNAVESEEFKIIIVHKGVLKAAGFTDASPFLHKDEENKEPSDVNV